MAKRTRLSPPQIHSTFLPETVLKTGSIADEMPAEEPSQDRNGQPGDNRILNDQEVA